MANRKRKYFRLGLGYLREDVYFSIYKTGNLNIRIGWDFSFTRNFGFQIDIGPGFMIFEDEIEKFEVDGWFNWDWDEYGGAIFPSIGIKTYYRL